mgnify:CR=1 FL=1
MLLRHFDTRPGGPAGGPGALSEGVRRGLQPDHRWRWDPLSPFRVAESQTRGHSPHVPDLVVLEHQIPIWVILGLGFSVEDVVEDME